MQVLALVQALAYFQGKVMPATQVRSAQLKDGDITDSDIAAANKDGAAGTASLRTLGTGASQACAGNDSRLSNSRTPTSHGSTHEGGGSDTIKRSVCIVPFDSSETVTVGDGKISFCVPAHMNGLNLTAATASVNTPGTTSGTTDIQLRRKRSGSAADMLGTKITLSVSEYFASDGVVDGANDDVATGDLIFVDVDAVNGTAPVGLSVTLTFS